MCRKGAWGLRFDVKKEGNLAWSSDRSQPKGCFFISDVQALHPFLEEQGGEVMAYIALYRKWRPQVFRELVGQEHISKTLSNAITAGRIGHAYLFSGPRGTGKTSTAKIFAKAINCEKGPTPEPCGVCAACRAIREGNSPDVYEIDAASNRGIDEIRELRDSVRYASSGIRYRVYIIDEVHMLTMEAFNALLKTLEEPPENIVFILATTEAHKVPATIQSRCQRFDFHHITAREMEDRLAYVAEKSNIDAAEDALRLIAVQADGGMRDALSLLDQCAALSRGKVEAENVRKILGLVGHDWIYDMTKDMAEKNVQKMLESLAQLLAQGKDLAQILVELTLHLRSLMIYRAAGTVEGMDLYAESEAVLDVQSHFFSDEQLMMLIERLGEAQNELRWSLQPRVAVEVALLSCMRDTAGAAEMEAAVSSKPVEAPSADTARLAALEAKFAELEKRVNSKAAMRPSPSDSKTPAFLSPASGGKRKECTPSIAKRLEKTSVSMQETVPESEDVGIDGAAVFEEIKKAALAGKDPIFGSCLYGASFFDMSRKRFRIRFSTEFLADIVKGARKDWIEQMLKEKTGFDLRLEKVYDKDDSRFLPKSKAESEKTAPAEDPYADVPPPDQAPVETSFDIDALPKGERERLKSAAALLGGRIEPIAEESLPEHGDADVPSEASSSLDGHE